MLSINENISLKNKNTFGIDVAARWFTEITSAQQLAELKQQKQFAGHKLILGGGSNILFTQNYNGWVIKNAIKGIKLLKETDNEVFVEANAGENWHQFVLYCISNNWAGVENMSLIPGQVGTAPIQNIGAYGVELKDVFYELTAWNLQTEQFETFDNSACNFGYRNSIFKTSHKGQYVITSVVFKLSKTPVFNVSYGAIQNTLTQMGVTKLSIKAISDVVIKIRQSKLPSPKDIGNAGSFFKNPVITEEQFNVLKVKHPNLPSYPAPSGVKVPAGWLIDQAGWKGKTFNNYGVHKNQALVLVNYGHAKGSDIKALAYNIKADVLNKYGIDLEPEVNMV